jgi:rhodanese-related sulfurtransferase
MTGPQAMEIEPEAVQAMLDAGAPVAIVDVREPWELEICAIAGSLNVPLHTLPERHGEIARDRPVVVLCHHGGRSLQATMWLRRNGVDRAMNMTGGIDAWARRVDRSLRLY